MWLLGRTAARRCLRAGGRPAARRLSSSGPPWRLLFFGSDHFAVESLKVLTSNRSSSGGVVETLEVVALPGDVPVKRFALQNQLPVHSWPPHPADGQFDVGVVVSFGCLLPEKLINKFPHGILNVHPSLLPRWRGPAPIFHTIMHGDAVTGSPSSRSALTGLMWAPSSSRSSIRSLKAALQTSWKRPSPPKEPTWWLLDTLRTLPERVAHRREQSRSGGTFAPKINASMSWVQWEEQTCAQIGCLQCAIGSRIPLRTSWMGRTVTLLDFVGRCHISLSGERSRAAPGSVSYQKESNTLAVSCKSLAAVPLRIEAEQCDESPSLCVNVCSLLQDGWVGFRSVVLRKRLTAGDFYNGYLHRKSACDLTSAQFISRKHGGDAKDMREDSAS
ncbi:hypothetical protein KUCAC02_035901 [Chaenocephalus aceratus]|nr:hypothetical protein KUCAC02_035901 [Chaenocephalus aceratus]